LSKISVNFTIAFFERRCHASTRRVAHVSVGTAVALIGTANGINVGTTTELTKPKIATGFIRRTSFSRARTWRVVSRRLKINKGKVRAFEGRHIGDTMALIFVACVSVWTAVTLVVATYGSVIRTTTILTSGHYTTCVGKRTCVRWTFVRYLDFYKKRRRIFVFFIRAWVVIEIASILTARHCFFAKVTTGFRRRT